MIMPNQHQDHVSNEGTNPTLPVPPLEFGPEEISPPTMARTYIVEEVQHEPPADVKEMNKFGHVALFLSMGVLAVILFSLLLYFFV